MKKLLLSISLSFFSSIIFGQIFYGLTFDDQTQMHHLRMVPANHNSLWQIGKPTKKTFTGAYSIPNVIVTDTINSYPINDTSGFTIFHLARWGWISRYEVYLTG